MYVLLWVAQDQWNGFYSYLERKAIWARPEDLASRNVLLKPEPPWDCFDQCEAKVLDISLVWRRAFRCYRTSTGTSNASSLHTTYSVLGLGQNRVKPGSSLVCQLPMAVPGVPQLQPTTWHSGSIHQERLYNKQRISARKIQTLSAHKTLIVQSGHFCSAPAACVNNFSAYPQTVSVLDHLISI